MWLNFQDFWPDALPMTYYPIIFLCLAGFIILNPFPIMYHQSRKWFATAHFRLLLSGLFPVEFRDFWLGDMFCSLTYTLGVSNIREEKQIFLRKVVCLTFVLESRAFWLFVSDELG
jgi:hypothetical protein